MRFLYLILAVFIASFMACSKSNDLRQRDNTNISAVPPVTIRIDTVIKYTPFYYSWVGSQKTFDFPVLDGVSNPVINVYYQVANQSSWTKLPDGFTAWFVRNGKTITVYVRLMTTEIAVKIVAAW